MRIRGWPVRPTTRWGRAACWLGLGFLAWFALNQTLMGLRQQAPDALPRAFLIGQGLVGLTFGAAAGVVALVAMGRQRERSVLVALATLPLLFVVVFLLGELLVPH